MHGIRQRGKGQVTSGKGQGRLLSLLFLVPLPLSHPVHPVHPAMPCYILLWRSTRNSMRALSNVMALWTVTKSARTAWHSRR